MHTVSKPKANNIAPSTNGAFNTTIHPSPIARLAPIDFFIVPLSLYIVLTPHVYLYKTHTSV